MSNAVLLALPDLSPPLAVEILPKGLVVNRFLVNFDGKTHDLVVGPSDPALHGQNPHKYQNSIIGRYTNRLPVGATHIEKDGIKSELEPLANGMSYTYIILNSHCILENPRVSLHGGREGFDTRDWEPIDIDDATLFSSKETAVISTLPSSQIFRLISPHGDQGFPGELLVEVLFAMSSGSRDVNETTEHVHVGSLFIVYRAKLLSAGESEVTPINLTQHWGFNLEASLANKASLMPDIKNHRLLIKSDNILALDDLSLSTGKWESVIGTPWHQTDTLIGDNFPASGHDSYHVFKSPLAPVESIRLPLASLPELDFFQEVLAAPARTDPLVRLSSERSGFSLSFDSNQPGVQFYSANDFNGKGTRKPIHGWSGRDNDGYAPHTFAFLEFHEPLAAWLHPETAVSGDTLLTSNDLYNNFTRVDVLCKPPPRLGDEE
ncbi:galactose mutarotase-like protein [Hysterangium stoloniferum]|nr:galactose mutarotase-like protein [Hysterangium stoloniferum]